MTNHVPGVGSRAGRYVKQISGYRAFIPAPLPPTPPIQLAGELQSLLSKADLALGRLDGSIQTLPNPDLFIMMYVRKEAVLSSQIEGTQSSLQDLLAAEARVLNANQPRDVDEVVNYVAAMKHGLQRLEALPVSVRLIREIHGVLLRGVRGAHLTPGELRTSQNWIGPGGATLNDATFVPPPPGEVPRALGDLETFIHAASDLPVLISIGLAHAQFETIHPFLDGNGRVGRLLVAFLLCERSVLQKPVLYLSHYFKRFRSEYYGHLQAVRDHGDWEGWLAFFLRGIVDVSNQATETARKILFLRESHRSLILDKMGRTASSALRVLENLYEYPIVTIESVCKSADVTFAAGNNIARKMVEHGILVEITGQRRNRRFRYSPYVELFTEP